MKTLVTGGAGFIGSNIVNRLVEDGHEVKVIDNESSDAHEHPYWNSKAENYKEDINNYKELKRIMQGVDVVFHLAAEARIQPTIDNPRLAVQTNVLGTCNVLQAARECGVKRVVYSSTSSAYGLTNPIPNTEDMPKDCLNPYSVSKTAGEELCKLYTDMFGVETVTFRYFNVYGKNQPFKGQYAPVIGIFQRQHNVGEPMTVVGDGLQRRDYVNVLDVVEANILAATTTNKNVIGEIFNLGTGTNHSVLDLVKLVGGEDVEYKHLPQREGEARETLSDSSKASRMLEWYPKVKLEEWINEDMKKMPITIAITTYHRFNFLSKNIDGFLELDGVDKIIIVDDNTPDFQKIKERNWNQVELYQNNTRLGCYLNKFKSLSYLNDDEWCIMLDSDNQIDHRYIESIQKEEEKNGLDVNTVYLPVAALPTFNYQHQTGIVVNQENFNTTFSIETPEFNTANFFIHSSAARRMNEIRELYFNDIVPTACDAYFMNYLLVFGGCRLKFLEGMVYNHHVHEHPNELGGSNYVALCRSGVDFKRKFHWKMPTSLGLDIPNMVTTC